MNKKIIFIPLVCLFALLLFSKNIQFIKADSGFDSSYDSGSSWDSSSDYSSSSSFDSSYSSSSSGGSSSMSVLGMAIIFELFCSIHYFVFAFQPIGRAFGRGDSKKSMIIALILFGIRALIVIVMDFINPYYFIIDFISLFILAFIIVPVLNVFSKTGSKIKTISNNINYTDLNADILSKYGISNKEDLKQKLFENYLAIQNAWMNFDEHSLRLLLTDELYNMYSSQLATLRTKGQRNIMSNFKYVDSKIFDIRQDNDILTLKLFLNVTMLDYIVDNSNNVVRGNKNMPIDISYEITFEKSLNKNIDSCPNCGAKVIDENNPRCPYCNAVILNGSNDWVMSKKECIKQK